MPPQAHQITFLRAKSPSQPMKGEHRFNKLATAYTLVISGGVIYIRAVKTDIDTTVRESSSAGPDIIKARPAV